MIAEPHALAISRLVGLTRASVEEALILATLDATAGNRTHAAAMLGLSLRTLRNKLVRYTASEPMAKQPLTDS